MQGYFSNFQACWKIWKLSRSRLYFCLVLHLIVLKLLGFPILNRNSYAGGLGIHVLVGFGLLKLYNKHVGFQYFNKSY
jgi:hypothetical protein